MSDSFLLRANDGTDLFVYRWLPATAPRAVVQIAHGAAEHAGRYARIAGELTKAGYAVYANDHRGHGKTAAAPERAGIVGPDGWNTIVGDAKYLTDHLAVTHPGCPIVLLGHSMGSMLAQQYIQRWGSGLSGVILSGTASAIQPGAEDLAERVTAAIERDGPDSPSMDFAMLFLGFNEPFIESAPASGPTGFEWLSRDENEVQRYVDDPWCGFLFSNGFVGDFAPALESLWAPGTENAIPKKLPVMIIAGDQDPVGEFGVSVHALTERYRAVGLTVTEILYPGARHEIFNETNRDEVHKDVVDWLARL